VLRDVGDVEQVHLDVELVVARSICASMLDSQLPGPMKICGVAARGDSAVQPSGGGAQPSPVHDAASAADGVPVFVLRLMTTR
jgi:hypothetical protein